jgi:hypothetical protein
MLQQSTLWWPIASSIAFRLLHPTECMAAKHYPCVETTQAATALTKMPNHSQQFPNTQAIAAISRLLAFQHHSLPWPQNWLHAVGTRLCSAASVSALNSAASVSALNNAATADRTQASRAHG